MTTQHFIHKKWVQALVLVLLLSACGEKSDTTTNLAINASTGKTGSTELINGIPVPPEPDPVANNATLVGIDANGNGVRDDIERKIAQSVAPSTTANSGALVPDGVTYVAEPYKIEFFSSPEYKKYLDTVYSTSTIEASEIIKVQDALDCYVQKNKVHKYKRYLELTFNSKERLLSYTKFMSNILPSITIYENETTTSCN